MFTIKSPFNFRGGVHPAYHKELSAESAIRAIPMPAKLVVPLSQHLGAPARAMVKPGDNVVKGQLIGEQNGFVSAPVHAPCCGKVVGIEPTRTPAGRLCDAIVIESGECGPVETLPTLENWQTIDKKTLLQRIAEAGIVGMGGAGFPASVKLSPPTDKPIDTLVLNGAECEPYLTADYRMMLEHADEIRLGAEIARYISGAKSLRIAVEDNKPQAIAALEKALADVPGDVGINVLKTIYPQGSEKQQIYAITGRKVPRGGLPMDVGCIVENISTVFAIYDAVYNGNPLTQRVITVTGAAVTQPSNLLAPCGTLYRDLIDACGGIKNRAAKVISGGPMMGFTISSLDIATGKTASGLLLLPPSEVVNFTSQACIACGRCVSACPMQLSPAELSLFIEADDLEGAEELALMDCLECGACAYICPACRPLVHHMRRGKAEVLAKRAAARKT